MSPHRSFVCVQSVFDSENSDAQEFQGLFMQKIWLFSLVLVLALGVAAAQTQDTAGTQNPATGSSGSSSTTTPSQSSTTTGGSDANGMNQKGTSQTGATGTSGNTSSVGSKSANVSSPATNSQSSTSAGANSAYPTDQNSATGASTGVGVSADPRKNKVDKSQLPRVDESSKSSSTSTQTNPH
jgi:hypothetical protein